MATKRVLLGLVAALFSTAALAQPPYIPPLPVPPREEPPPTALVNPPPLPLPCLNPAPGTLLDIEINQDLSSNDNVQGDQFQITLLRPVVVNGVTVLPEGLTGVGEVVDAHHSGIGGKPGELIVAARYLDLNGVHVPTSGLKVSAAGQDQSRLSMAVGVAGMVDPTGIATLASILVRGGEIRIPAGAQATIKIAQSSPKNQYCIVSGSAPQASGQQGYQP